MPSSGAIIRALRWIAPIATGACFGSASLFAFCTLQKPSRSKRFVARLRQLISVILSSSIFVLFISQALSYIWLHFHDIQQTDIPQDFQVYLGGSIFIWGTFTVNLLNDQRRIWYPYLAAWVIAAVLETCIFFSSHLYREDGPYSTLGPAFLITRMVCMGLIIGCNACFLFCYQGLRKKVDEECRPLISPRNTNTADDDTLYSSDEEGDTDSSVVDDDDDDGDEAGGSKEMKARQKRRLKASGNWLAYLADFKIPARLAWPSGHRPAQMCLGVLLVIILADRALNLLVPRQLGIITDKLTAMHGTGDIPVKDIGLWMLFMWLGSSSGLSAITQFCQLPIEQQAYHKIGTTAFSHIMNLSMDFHNNKHSGELIAAISQGQHLYRLCDFIFLSVGPMVFDLAIALVYVTCLFDVSITLILIMVGVGYTCIGTKATSWAMKRRRRFNQALRNESKVQNESIGNWQTVAHFNMANHECNQYAKAVDEHNTARGRFFMTTYTGFAAQNLILLLGQLLAALVAAYRVSKGSAPVGNFITLVTYWNTIEAPLTSVSFSFRQLSQMLIDSERLLELLRTEPSVAERSDAKPLRLVEGRVEFDNVRFSYDVRKTSLDQVSFVAEPGKTVALVGETGGGKSTILKLLFRYYDVSGGSIMIDGQDVRRVTLNSLRSAFGMVPQDPSLFNISIMENVRYARLEASDEEVKEACRAAAIHDRIISFPDGYRSRVGERGVKLSGGELQRIAIARAILRNPQIVLLDEATSMVDAETEAEIQEAFKTLTAGRTTFVVAHRLSTIQHADLILVVHNGQIIERGTHDQLYALDGKYTRLWSKQRSKQTEVQNEAAVG